MMNNVAYGDIVQLNPRKNEMFGGCLVFVTDVRAWGVKGYIPMPDQNKVCLNLRWDDFEYCGQAHFMTEEKEDLPEEETLRGLRLANPVLLM